MKKIVWLSLGLVLFFTTMTAYGKMPVLKSMINYPFTAGDKTFPAGMYEFVLDETGELFQVMGEGNTVLVPIVTRLGGDMRSVPQGAYLVFDQVGETYLLAEIWLPGKDGYLLLATKGPHGHKTVNIK
jgi:hypothetical protein